MVTSSRKKPPFGIAQIGKSFRNEITPGNFIFRTREFEQMEMEFFVKPGEDEEWHQYWIDRAHPLVRRPRHRPRQPAPLRAPAGEALPLLQAHRRHRVPLRLRRASEWGELEGIANRTDFDLTTHSEDSGQDLSYFDQANGERYIPYVIEPAAGLTRPPDGLPGRRLHRGRGAQHQGRRRQAHRAAARPAARAGQGRGAAAVPQRRPVARRPRTWPPSCARSWNVEFDDSGAIGRRYRRQDEIGTPYCVTVDFDTLEDHAVTVRERDTMTQERVGLDRISAYFAERLVGA